MALGSLLCYLFSPNKPFLLVVAALFIQLRLLCNLFDGMVAVEHGKKTNTGDIYNDAPDRVADVFIILGASLSIPDHSYALHFGWAASLIAVLSAYIRVLGRSLNTPSYFIGPMAKQHRMFLLTASSIIDFILLSFEVNFSITYISLIIIIILGLLTCVKRLSLILKDKEAGV